MVALQTGLEGAKSAVPLPCPWQATSIVKTSFHLPVPHLHFFNSICLRPFIPPSSIPTKTMLPLPSFFIFIIVFLCHYSCHQHSTLQLSHSSIIPLSHTLTRQFSLRFRLSPALGYIYIYIFIILYRYIYVKGLTLVVGACQTAKAASTWLLKRIAMPAELSELESYRSMRDSLNN